MIDFGAVIILSAYSAILGWAFSLSNINNLPPNMHDDMFRSLI